MPYPTPLGNRLAYDIDGSVIIVKRDDAFGGDWESPDPNAVRAMNSTEGGGMIISISRNNGQDFGGYDVDNTFWHPSGRYRRMIILFPEPVRLTGIFWAMMREYQANSFNAPRTWMPFPATISWSKNTFNGIDGTWTTLPGTFSGHIPPDDRTTPPSRRGTRLDSGDQGSFTVWGVKDVYRNVKSINGSGQEPLPEELRNVKGLAFDLDFQMNNPYGSSFIGLFMHLYGYPDREGGNKFLAAWHPTLERRITPGYLYEDGVVPSSSEDRSFRVKNLSATQTATAIEVTAVDEYLAKTPPPEKQYLFSFDQREWFSVLPIGALGPNTVSPTIYVRRVTPKNAPVGLHAPRLEMAVGSWN